MRGPGQENFYAGPRREAPVFHDRRRGGGRIRRPYETTIGEEEKRSEKGRKNIFVGCTKTCNFYSPPGMGEEGCGG